MLNLALWDAENEETAPAVRDMTVGPATTKDCEEFALRYHYSTHASNQLWRFGLWHGVTLWGIAGFNLPTRETCESLFGEEHGADKVAHLSRLALAEHAPRNSESRLLSGALAALHADAPRLWAVVTYADILQGHIGYVYQATNALYTGIGSKGVPRYVAPDGRVLGTYLNGHGMGVREARRRGFEVIEGRGKHRYVYLLGSRAQRRARRKLLKLPVLPYPKTLDELPVGGGPRPAHAVSRPT